MKNCCKCGEYTKCRDRVVYEDLTGRFKATEPTCEECDIVLRMQEKQDEKEREANKKKEQKAWIKQRDKLLKEHEK